MKKFQLPLQTLDLIVGFMVWVLLSSLLPFIKEDIAIPPEYTGLVTAIPVILGSVLRIPLGSYANRFGARSAFLISFTALLFPVYFISEAQTFSQLIIGGIFLGIGGAVFSIGVTSLPKYYPKNRHGFVNGVYGFGNVGTALTAFAAPIIATQLGWSTTIKLYLVLLLVMIAMNFFVGDRHEPKVTTSVLAQIRSIYKNKMMWCFSFFYFVTFGAFVALTVFLPNALVVDFQLDKVSAGVLTAVFVLAAASFRVLGGWLSDHFDCLRLLGLVFFGMTIGAGLLAVSTSPVSYLVGIYLISVLCGMGNGVVFKLVPTYFLDAAGPVNGIVSMMGGLGGFFPPLALSFSLSVTDSYTPAFVAFMICLIICLVLTYGLHKQPPAPDREQSLGKKAQITD